MAMNDYKNELTKYKLLLVAVTILATVVNILVIKSSFDSAERERNEIFVADSQNTLLLALSKNIRTNRGNEAKAVVNKMHTHLFYMSPTASDIEGGITKACGLSDASVKQYCDKQRESGWYNKMMAEGISMEYVTDSIVLYDSDKQGYDFFVRLYGKTSVISSTSIEFKSLVTTCYVQESARTVDNPNGYICCQFNIERTDRLRFFRRENGELRDAESESDN